MRKFTSPVLLSNSLGPRKKTSSRRKIVKKMDSIRAKMTEAAFIKKLYLFGKDGEPLMNEETFGVIPGDVNNFPSPATNAKDNEEEMVVGNVVEESLNV